MLCQIQLNSLSIPIFYIVLWFILPLIVAFILFKHLPTTADVSGPFKGLALKFTGAFAGYFILFFIAYLAFGDWFKKPVESSEVWTITGDIKSDDNRFDLQTDKPSIVPLAQHFQKNKFEVKVIVRSDANGLLEFPMLTLTALNYQSEPFPYLTFNKYKRDLSSLCILEDPQSRRIKLKDPLVLKPHLPEAVQEASPTISVDTTLN